MALEPEERERRHRESVRRSNARDWQRQLDDPEYRDKRRAQKNASNRRLREDPDYLAKARAADLSYKNSIYETKVRAAHYKARYGITLEDYDRMMLAQGGVCALCDAPPTEKKRLAVDHCHETGRVRGLLCTKCNSALERVEKPEWTNRAEAYLQRVSAIT